MHAYISLRGDEGVNQCTHTLACVVMKGLIQCTHYKGKPCGGDEGVNQCTHSLACVVMKGLISARIH